MAHGACPARHGRWVAAGIFLVLLAGQWTVPGCRRARKAGADRSSRLAVLTAALAARPIAGRVAEHVPYRPFDAARPVVLTSLPAEALTAAQSLLQRDPTEDTDSVSARAAVELWTGHADAALSTVLSGLERHPEAASLWTSLAAVYLELGRRERPGLRLTARALDAASRAVTLAPSDPGPAFNQALALEALGLDQTARDVWTRAAALETDPQWRREAQERLAALEAAMRDEWPARRTALLGPSDVADDRLRATAEQWPQETREAIEEALLPAWGRATLAGDAAGARHALDRARGAAAHLAKRTSDALLTHAIAAIDRGGAPAKKALAEAHVAYGAGVTAYEATRREEALGDFRTAHRLMIAASSPFELRARMQIGVLLYQLNRFDEAEAWLARVERDAARGRYVALHARIEWLLGLPLTQKGHIEPAVSAYRRSAAEFAAVGESENLASMSSTAADTLRRVGEHTEGWALLSQALSRMRSVRAPRRRLTILLNGSLFSADDGLPRAALTFQDASLQAARERGAATTIIEGLTRRARLRLQAGDPDGAARDLDEADRLLPGVTSPSLHEYVGGWLNLARAEWQTPRDPAAAVGLFEQARALFARAEPDEVPRLSVGLGRASLDAGRDQAAEGYLMDGLRLFEDRWRKLSRDQYRVSYVDDGWRIFDALIQLHVIHQRDPERGFEFAERGRAKALSGGAGDHVSLTLDRLRTELPENASVLYYAVLDDRLLIWIIEHGGTRLVERPITRDALQRQVLAYRKLVDARGVAAESLAAGAAALHATLIPAEVLRGGRRGPLAIVADGFLNTVPFATLLDPDTHHVLVEDRPLMMAPSATHVLGAGPSVRSEAALRGLFVGGSTTGAAAERLGPLPHASAELRDVAALYPQRATILENEAATLDALRRTVRGNDVLHFAAHAVANESFPWRSQLLLAPGPGDPEGAASLETLRTVDFSGLRLVVLSACRTASGPIARGEGVISLVRPFLEQRVPAVVGTLWDVDDAAARALLTRFHASYAKTRDPIAALQDAQRQLLASNDQELRSPRSWGAFIVTAPLR